MTARHVSCGSIHVSLETNSFPCKVGVKSPGICHAVNSTRRILESYKESMLSQNAVRKKFQNQSLMPTTKVISILKFVFGGHFFRSDYELLFFVFTVLAWQRNSMGHYITYYIKLGQSFPIYEVPPRSEL